MNVICLFTLAVYFVLAATLSPGCEPGWFGSSCQYNCHCESECQVCDGNRLCQSCDIIGECTSVNRSSDCPEDNCDADGQCINGTVCRRGWFGPSCQYVELIQNASGTVTTNSGTNVNNVLSDGDDTTCLSDSTLQFVNVTWSEGYPFTWLRLHVNREDLLHNITVQFRNSTSTSATVDCTNRQNAAISDTTLDIHCDLSVTISQVILTGEGIKALCSLYISGGRNVALRQNSTQTSTIDGQTADKAVEGDRYGIYFKDNYLACTHTKPNQNPTSWSLTLSRQHYINRYVIYNRRDCCEERLQGFTLTSYDTTNTTVFTKTDTNDPPQFVYTFTSVVEKRPVSAVRVDKRTDSKALTLCEVELYGDSVCQAGKYGRECEKDCNCAVQSEACFVTGSCRSGCATGFYGDSCQTECPNRSYGQNCSLTCSVKCKVNETAAPAVCHHVTGRCVLGCVNDTAGDECSALPIIESDSTGDDNVGLIAGVVIAVLVVLTLSVVAAFVLWRKRRQPETQTQLALKHLSEEPHEAELTSKSNALENEDYPNEQIQQNAPRNIFNEQKTTAVLVKNLADFLSNQDPEFFKKQFEDVPAVNMKLSMKIGLSIANRHKNRSTKISAYDHSRVHLKTSEENHNGDYINASHVQGYSKQEKFIASEGPNKKIKDDFVRMLWQQKPDKVVMLTNLMEEGKPLCDRYWPEEDEMMFSGITVELKTVHVFPDFIIRKLALRKENRPTHHLTQFHFTSWPDGSVPANLWSLVDFQQRVFRHPTSKPVIVHGSAGQGRTGTFIALCHVLREAEDKGTMDFYSTLVKLRNERPCMIQTLEQYIFLHRAAQIAMLCRGGTVRGSNITDLDEKLPTASSTGQADIELEYKAICRASTDGFISTTNQNTTASSKTLYENSRATGSTCKNMVENDLPKDSNKLYLMDGRNNPEAYKSAVLVPGFTKRDNQILAQLPSPRTRVDFWQSITQYKLSLIVVCELNTGHKDEQTAADYLPTNEVTPLVCGPFIIETGPKTATELWEEQQLYVSIKGQPGGSNETVDPSVVHVKRKCTSCDVKTLLEIMEHIRELRSKDEMTLYMCRDGASYSGLVCVLILLLDRLDNDHCSTVPLVVGAIKSVHPQAIPTLEQYKLLYDVLENYKPRGSHYLNFEDVLPEATQDPAYSDYTNTKSDNAHVYDTLNED